MPPVVLELEPRAVPRLAHLSGTVGARTRAVTVEWFDTADRALLRGGAGLSVRGGTWLLERLHPPAALATTQDRGELNLPGPVEPVAKRAGHTRTFAGPGVTLDLLRLPHACQLLLAGEPETVFTVAERLARDLHVRVPCRGLTASVLDSPEPPGPSLLVDPHRSAGDNLANLVAALLHMLLERAAEVAHATGPEPVHQMRVATRRLRSALSVFAPALPSPALDRMRPALKDLAGRLGGARDWDVFLSGTGAAMQDAFPDDRRCRALLRAAERQRKACYAGVRGLLEGAEFRALTVELACAAAMRPWPDGDGMEAFARDALDRRLRSVRKAGKGFATLPIPALHELRKKSKRLRYTADFMASLFPVKAVRRFTKRVEALQEELGHLNDGAVTAGLMHQLGRLERSYAAGLVEGFSTARATPARQSAEQAWKRLRNATPFWQGTKTTR